MLPILWKSQNFQIVQSRARIRNKYIMEDALLKQYAKEVRVIQGSTAWKTAIVYEHILRAVDNIGINAAYVIKFFLRGRLSNEEVIQYIRSKILFLDYLEQASSFSPEVDRKLKMIRNGKNYRKLLEM